MTGKKPSHNLSTDIVREILDCTLNKSEPLPDIAARLELDVDIVSEVVEIELMKRIRKAFPLNKYT